MQTVAPPAPGHDLPLLGHPHVPPVHVSPAPQTLPHAPQLRGSVSVSVHRPPHVVPPVQVHTPETHVSTSPHARAHAPQ